MQPLRAYRVSRHIAQAHAQRTDAIEITPRVVEAIRRLQKIHTHAIAEDVAALPEKERFVVNCASQEYWRAARETHLAERLGVRVVTCAFPGPAVHAKSARGAMARHVAEGAETMEDLARFRGRRGEWRVDDEQSDEKTLVFRRVEEASAKPRAGAKKRDASAEPRAGAKKRDDARTPAPRKRIRKTSA